MSGRDYQSDEWRRQRRFGYLKSGCALLAFFGSVAAIIVTGWLLINWGPI